MSKLALRAVITEINDMKEEDFSSHFSGTNVVALPTAFKIDSRNLMMKDGLEIYRYIDESLSTESLRNYAIEHNVQVKGRRNFLMLVIKELESRGFNRPKMVNI